jgi:hypothetical protein
LEEEEASQFSVSEAYTTVVLVFDHIPPESSGRGNSEGEYNDREQVLDAFALGTGLVDEEREAAADKATLRKIAQVSWSCLNLAFKDGDMHSPNQISAPECLNVLIDCSRVNITSTVICVLFIAVGPRMERAECGGGRMECAR